MQYLSEHPLRADCTVLEIVRLARLHGLRAAVNAARLGRQLSSSGVPQQQCGEETKGLLQGTCSKARSCFHTTNAFQGLMQRKPSTESLA